MTDTPPAPSSTLPVIQEDVRIGSEAVAHGGVRVRLVPQQLEQHLPVTCDVETAEVDRRRVERVVARRSPPWQDGADLVIPVYEERMVTAVQLVLVEEVRVRTRVERHAGTATVTTRHDAVAIERRGADGHWRPEASGPTHSHTRSTSMKQTLVAMFDTQSAALAAKQRLLARGIAAWAIQITDAQPATGDTAASTSATTTATTPSPGETGVLASVQRFFADLFSGGDDDVHAYSDAVQRGGALLKVEVDDDTELDMARDELGQAGAADIDERLDSWRRARAATGGSETTSRTSDATTAVASDADRQGVIPVVQESVAVGKRSLRAGGLRVYARVVEEPVRESVTLREERATVDRRPVDRPATQAELTGMAERTIEVTEMVERPVVEKTARVVEEVVVGKDVRQTRTTVEETARHTEVEVQTLAGDAAASSLSVDDRLDREDFERHFGTSGQRFEDVRPAYAFGRSLRGEDRYTGLSWDEVEPQARQRWASTYPDSPWERTKDAVRRSWDRLTE